jgi:hypothetical protein
VPCGVGEDAIGRELHGAPPRQALALRRVDDEEAVAVGGDVERAAGLLERAATQVGRGIGSRMRVANEASEDAFRLEAVGARVGEIVRDDLLTRS